MLCKQHNAKNRAKIRPTDTSRQVFHNCRPEDVIQTISNEFIFARCTQINVLKFDM